MGHKISDGQRVNSSISLKALTAGKGEGVWLEVSAAGGGEGFNPLLTHEDAMFSLACFSFPDAFAASAGMTVELMFSAEQGSFGVYQVESVVNGSVEILSSGRLLHLRGSLQVFTIQTKGHSYLILIEWLWLQGITDALAASYFTPPRDFFGSVLLVASSITFHSDSASLVPAFNKQQFLLFVESVDDAPEVRL